MSTIITFPLPAGPNFTIPEVGELNWGQEVTNFLVALPSGIPPTAGTFTLTGDLSFGASFGLLSKYFTSVTTNAAHTGAVRLAKTDTLSWRNNLNSGDLPLGIDASDNLTFNGLTQAFSGAVNAGTSTHLAYYATSTNAVSDASGHSISGDYTFTGTSNSFTQDITTAAIHASGALFSTGLSISSYGSSIAIGAFPLDVNIFTTVPASSRTYTIPDTSTSTAQFVMTEGAQTINGAKTLGTDLAMGSHNITGLANGVNPQDAATVAQISAVEGFQPGDMKAAGYTAVPTGWLLCDGTSYVRATYPALFSAIGTTYGSADGTHFNVPNMVNAVPIGSGSIAAIGVTAGSATHTLSQSELPVALGTASSSVTDPGHVHGMLGYNAGGAQGYPFVNNGNSAAGQNTFPLSIQSNTTGITVGTTITNGSGGNAHSIVQPSLGVTWFIKQ